MYIRQQVNINKSYFTARKISRIQIVKNILIGFFIFYQPNPNVQFIKLYKCTIFQLGLVK